ncbi:MAG: hypothetical protein Q9222_003098 [Ikaeria aurantiellina]
MTGISFAFGTGNYFKFSFSLELGFPPRTQNDETSRTKPSLLKGTYTLQDIDSTILQVSRSIYKETLPVLYGNNTFVFCKARKLREFSHGVRDPTTQKNNKCAGTDLPLLWPSSLGGPGRFALVRFIILRLMSDYKPYRHQAGPDCTRIWSHWYSYFYQFSFCRGFPALERLELDFTVWELSASDAVRVTPFIEKLRPAGGLDALTIKGVTNEANLEDFRKELVKPGGTFLVKK